MINESIIMSNQYNKSKTVYWICDKVGCKFENYRYIRIDAIIYEDTCEKCKRNISEPITIEIDKNDKPKTSK